MGLQIPKGKFRDQAFSIVTSLAAVVVVLLLLLHFLRHRG